MSDSSDAKRPAPSLFTSGEDAFDDDIRPCPDLEDDHSDPGFDMSAEVDAHLGPAAASPPAGSSAAAPPTPPAATPAPAPAAPAAKDGAVSPADNGLFDDPEDIRPCADPEDDHSDACEDPVEPDAASVAAVISSAAAPSVAASAAAPGGAKTAASCPPPDEESAEALFPEFVRPCPDGEDDHSDANIDIDAEIERQLGQAPETADAARPDQDPEIAALTDSDEVHPGLAAALLTSYAYATKGLEDDAPDGPNATAPDSRNEEGLGVDDDSRFPLDPEDSGDDDALAEKPHAFANAGSEKPEPDAGSPADNGADDESPEDDEEEDDDDGDEDDDDEDDDDEDDEDEEDEDEADGKNRGPGALGRRAPRGFLFRLILFALLAAAILGGSIFSEQLLAFLPQPVRDALPKGGEPLFSGAASFLTWDVVVPGLFFLLAGLYIAYRIFGRGAPRAISAKEYRAARSGAGEDTEDQDTEDEDDRPMAFADHFRELRKRLFRAFLLLLAGFFVCWPFAEEIFSLLTLPLLAAMPEKSTFIFTSPPEAFFTYMKVALVAGFFATSPLIFYQVWAFVAPGLYKEEKLYILPVALFSALFFISGGAFCYFIVFPFAFEFFMSYNTGIIQAMPALSETLSFVLKLLLAFGLVFEMPLFSFFLSRMGIITADMMRRVRRYAMLIMFIVAAILTPPDVVSQLLMAGPLLLLYEVSIFIAAFFGRKKPGGEEEDEEEEEEEDDDDDEQDDSPVIRGPA